MGKSPDKIVADIDAAQNKEDLELPKRMAKAAVNLVKPKATKPDTGTTTNPMGDKYKKGGKIMSKKTKKYEEGGEVEFETARGQNKNIGDDVRARAMAAMSKKDSEEPAVPKKVAAKLTPKAEAPKEEPKAAPKSKESAFKDSSSSFKDSSSSFKGTPSSFKNSSAALKDAASSFKEKPSSFKDSSSSFKGNAFKNAKSSFKSGGKVSSASKRADGCAIRGKTRA